MSDYNRGTFLPVFPLSIPPLPSPSLRSSLCPFLHPFLPPSLFPFLPFLPLSIPPISHSPFTAILLLLQSPYLTMTMLTSWETPWLRLPGRREEYVKLVQSTYTLINYVVGESNPYTVTLHSQLSLSLSLSLTYTHTHQ